MEASVLSQPAKVAAIGVRTPFLRLQSDERLIAFIRAGHEAAFEALVQRYRSRLLAFCRHMLRSREDAEDVLQEVFAAAYRAIVADEREILARPWLYRIARNMSLKHLGKRRPAAEGGVEDLDVAAAGGTVEAVHAREDLRQIVGDVQELPETQRTALLLREMEGLSYHQIAAAMDTSVPGVKSLLVRARVSLAEAAQGRTLSCEVVHLELRQAATGLVRLSGPARRHAKKCDACGAYSSELGLARRAAAAAFIPLLPLALLRELIGKLGAGAAGGTGAAGLATGTTAAGGGGAAAGGAASGAVSAAIGAIGAKTAVAVATATLVAAGAADIHRVSHHRHHASAPEAAAAPAPVATSASAQPVTHPYVRPATKPSSPASHHRHHSTKPSPSTTNPAPRVLPTTPAPKNSGTFADAPPPSGTKLKSDSKDPAPTDPASQPIGAPEPVQVQGFDPGSGSGGGGSSGDVTTP